MNTSTRLTIYEGGIKPCMPPRTCRHCENARHLLEDARENAERVQLLADIAKHQWRRSRQLIFVSALILVLSLANSVASIVGG